MCSLSVQPVPDRVRTKAQPKWNFDGVEEEEEEEEERGSGSRRRHHSRRHGRSKGALASQQRREAMCRRAFDRFDLNRDGGQFAPSTACSIITTNTTHAKRPPLLFCLLSDFV